MLEEVISVDLIEVVKNGLIQVRTNKAVMEDGKLISNSFHRHVVSPGDDYSAENAEVQALAASTHTAEVIAAYQAAQAAQIPA